MHFKYALLILTKRVGILIMSFRSASLKESKNKNSKRKREANGHIKDGSNPTDNGEEISQASSGEKKKRKKKK